MPSSITALRTQAAAHFAFRSVRVILVSIDTGSFAGACGAAATGGTRDVGYWAYPQPLPQGNPSMTPVAGRIPREIGNMAYPDLVPPGLVGRMAMTRQAFDTRHVAYSTPLPVGNGLVTFFN